MTDFEKLLKEKLNNEQFQVATHIDGPAVIMAGAGSGKTHTLISRVSNLIDKGIKPERILMLTFTNSAADEMKNRASKLLDERCKNIIACTYHKFCNMMLRRYGNTINITNYTILTPNENKNLIEYVKSSIDEYKDLKEFPSAKTLLAIYSKAINCDKSIEYTIKNDVNWIKYSNFVSEIENLHKLIVKYCYENKQLDYDALLVYMNYLLKNDEICEKIANKFDYIMVDEFQDTNNLQEYILLKLAKYNKNIVVVGDISQSIYAFRGANVRNLQNFNTKIDNCKTYVLNTNYRSPQTILDFANSVMNNNVKSWTYYDMKDDNKEGTKPIFSRPYDEFEQQSNVIDLIKDYYKKGIPYNDMAIIERGSMSSFGIEAELLKDNIPFEKRGGLKFMDYECVGDILAYLSVIADPYNVLSWFRLLKTHPYIGNSIAKQIADTCTNKDYLINIRWSKRKFYPELVNLDTNYKMFRNEHNFSKQLDLIIDYYFKVRQRALDLSRMKADSKIDAAEAIERDKTIINQLKNIASKYNTLVSFLDDIVLDSLIEDEDIDDKLIITTVHSAKGLEWKIVFIIDCVEGAFPSHIDYCNYGSDEDEEELRCFYVAITRAKEKLYIFSPKFKMKGGFSDRVNYTHYIVNSEQYLERR